MQTYRPELINHMDARREQRILAAKWRMARAKRQPAAAGPAASQTVSAPVTSGCASVVRA